MIRGVVVALLVSIVGADRCPSGLDCPGRCCQRSAGDNYCCPTDSYVVGPQASWWKDYWAVVIGCLVASIVISVILSLLCCFCCNSCWLHKLIRGGRSPELFVYDQGRGMTLGTVYYSPYAPPPASSSAYYTSMQTTSVVPNGSTLQPPPNGYGNGHSPNSQTSSTPSRSSLKVRFDDDTAVKKPY